MIPQLVPEMEKEDLSRKIHFNNIDLFSNIDLFCNTRTPDGEFVGLIMELNKRSNSDVKKENKENTRQKQAKEIKTFSNLKVANTQKFSLKQLRCIYKIKANQQQK